MQDNISSRTLSEAATGGIRLNVRAFAVTFALIWGIGLFILTWWIMAFDGATHEATLIGQLYRGYNISPVGSLIGLAWATADGLIGGALFAWLYNVIADHLR
ncbi:MAG TPA: bacteriophage holin [Candidatus Binataceae bacterium]|nr:bacteriophage holin [Candidatus Binataceae bacterium]